MTVRLYKSTDASAPTLTGSSGALITVLDAVLVNGYGSQTAAGWAKSFSGTNKATYRMATSSNTGFYLNVNDAAPGAAGAREARMTGFETASAVDTGTGQFPSLNHLAIGIGAVVLRKSTTADATARAWYIIADGSCMYMFVDTGDFVNPTICFPFMFGDIFSYKSSDSYRCLTIGRFIENQSHGQYDAFSHCSIQGLTGVHPFAGNLAGHYMPRHWGGIGGCQLVGKHWDFARQGQGGTYGSALTQIGLIANGAEGGTMTYGGAAPVAMGYNGNGKSMFPYPNGPDGALYMSPCWIHANGSTRGYMKGLWVPLHHQPLNHLDTFGGVGNLSGKSFINFTINMSDNGGSGGVNSGNCVIEYSDTWS